MTRLLLLVDDVPRSSAEETETWLRKGVSELTVFPDLESIEVSRLGTLMPEWPTAARWLIEAQVSSLEAARLLVDGPEASALLDDFRLLGMHPSVQVIDD